jgi:hypothetical protein
MRIHSTFFPRLAAASALALLLASSPAAAAYNEAALSFNGSSQYGHAAVIPVDMENVEMSAWVRWAGPAGVPDTTQMLFYNGNSSCGGWGVLIDDASGQILILVGGINIIGTDASLRFGRWQHLVVSRRDNAYTLLLDGIPLAVHGADGPYPLGTCLPDEFLVGAGSNGPASSGFKGSIAEVLVGTANPATNVANWPFDECAGSLATDTHGLVMELEGNPLWACGTPQDEVAALVDEIEALIAGGTLPSNKAKPLITKLEQVSAKLAGEQTADACDQLGALINQLNAYVNNGNLTAVQGQELIDATNTLKVNIGCEPPCPCNDPAVAPFFFNFVDGSTPIEFCSTSFQDGANGIIVGNPSLNALSFEVQPGQWVCGGFPVFGLPISPEQGQACANLLEQAANSQGVTCQSL